jgi:tryptophanyl-tRNA synthetase
VIGPPAHFTSATTSAPSRTELVLPFLSLVSDAELHRNPTVKAETEATGRPPTGLMLTYPVHQAADILFCHANLVPVGLDQLPHLETTRLIARRFNERYANRSPLFPEPDALLTATPMLAGLDGKKMSKTRGNGVTLEATEDQTAAVIRRAPSDSERHITYDPIARPAVANLLDLLAATTGEDPHDLADGIGNGGAGRLKQLLTEAINELLRPVRHRRTSLAEDIRHLDNVLDTGNARARQLADNTITKVHDLLGMTYANRR